MADAPPPKAAVVVLAAGASRRFGRPKQLLDWHGTPLVAHAAGTALAARSGPVVVVVGDEADAVRQALGSLDVTVANNSDWARGMSTSVRAGLAAVERGWPAVGAVVLTTCDQPLVPPKTIRALAEAVAAEGGTPIAACAYGGAVGVPAAFARRLFPELLRLEGDRGAKSLLMKRAPDVTAVPCPEAALDIDTEAEYSRVIAENP